MSVSRQSIGKYQIISELGRGATGKVYLADDPFGKRQVAIKIAYPEALNSSEDSAFYRSMFLNEASLAGKLNHPHIVQIYDAVVEEKSSYIVMEYVEGGTLEKFCAAEALLEPGEVAEIIFKCVRALAFAQSLGLTHRDLKPGNILHKEGTEIKIADFGRRIEHVIALFEPMDAAAVPQVKAYQAAAAQANVRVPKLCATESLEPFGSCRLCLVQIEGMKGYPASCTTPCADGLRFCGGWSLCCAGVRPNGRGYPASSCAAQPHPCRTGPPPCCPSWSGHT